MAAALCTTLSSSMVSVSGANSPQPPVTPAISIATSTLVKRRSTRSGMLTHRSMTPSGCAAQRSMTSSPTRTTNCAPMFSGAGV
ncbi:hypothetical protein ACQI4F_11355 [Mycolicibacterium vaccae]|uniref:hypothetical protein n=1 Tax=Mycolicibacterium vaccae TaxID=1810 RepID=UPI003CFA54C8